MFPDEEITPPVSKAQVLNQPDSNFLDSLCNLYFFFYKKNHFQRSELIVLLVKTPSCQISAQLSIQLLVRIAISETKFGLPTALLWITSPL